jgi:hypothetical protein
MRTGVFAEARREEARERQAIEVYLGGDADVQRV